MDTRGALAACCCYTSFPSPLCISSLTSSSPTLPSALPSLSLPAATSSHALSSSRPIRATISCGTTFRSSGFGSSLNLRRDAVPHSRRHGRFQICAVRKTFSSFDDMITNLEVPVLVDFYATWCGPCQYMVPILHDVGDALKDKVSIVKIDSDKYPDLASRYGVQALPTLILFSRGKPIDRFEGVLTAPKLIERIQNALSNSHAGV